MTTSWSIEEVSEWVKTLILSDDYCSKFMDAKIDGKQLSIIDEKKLKEMGITEDVDKDQILKQIASLTGKEEKNQIQMITCQLMMLVNGTKINGI